MSRSERARRGRDVGSLAKDMEVSTGITGVVPDDRGERKETSAAPASPSGGVTELRRAEPQYADPSPADPPATDPPERPIPEALPNPPAENVGKRPPPQVRRGGRPTKETKKTHAYDLPPSLGEEVRDAVFYLTEVQGERGLSQNVFVEDALRAWSRHKLDELGLDRWPPRDPE
jgi:hypothetical protein